MKKMPKGVRYIIRAVGFLVCLTLILIWVSYVLRPYSGSASRKNICGFYAEEDDSLDVVFVGSSSVFAFWQPMEFWKRYGVTSYNFSAGSMPPQTIKYCLKEIQKTQSPEVYVVDLRGFSTAESGYYQDRSIMNMEHEVPLRNVIDNFKYSLNRLEMIQECVPDSQDKLSYYLDLMKYHTEWSRLLDLQSLKFSLNSSNDYMKGFQTVERVRSLEVNDYSDLTERKALSARLETILRDLLEYCTEEELPVLFVVSASKQSEENKMLYNYMGDVISEYGHTFINTNDYADEIGLDFTTEYYDRNHVNIVGADKYTAWLGAYLTSHYTFEDKRGLAEYESWNEDYETWTEEMTAVRKNVAAKIQEVQNQESGL